MSVGVESLFTSALGLAAPWEVAKVDLDTGKRRIDFEVRCNAKLLSCPHCDAPAQRIHDRLRRSWRHLDFFQFEAWLHADVPRVSCTGCGKTTQVGVPWAREGSGFTALFEDLFTLAPLATDVLLVNNPNIANPAKIKATLNLLQPMMSSSAFRGLIVQSA